MARIIETFRCPEVNACHLSDAIFILHAVHCTYNYIVIMYLRISNLTPWNVNSSTRQLIARLLCDAVSLYVKSRLNDLNYERMLFDISADAPAINTCMSPTYRLIVRLARSRQVAFSPPQESRLKIKIFKFRRWFQFPLQLANVFAEKDWYPLQYAHPFTYTTEQNRSAMQHTNNMLVQKKRGENWRVSVWVLGEALCNWGWKMVQQSHWSRLHSFHLCPTFHCRGKINFRVTKRLDEIFFSLKWSSINNSIKNLPHSSAKGYQRNIHQLLNLTWKMFVYSFKRLIECHQQIKWGGFFSTPILSNPSFSLKCRGRRRRFHSSDMQSP